MAASTTDSPYGGHAYVYLLAIPYDLFRNYRWNLDQASHLSFCGNYELFDVLRNSNENERQMSCGPKCSVRRRVTGGDDVATCRPLAPTFIASRALVGGVKRIGNTWWEKRSRRAASEVDGKCFPTAARGRMFQPLKGHDQALPVADPVDSYSEASRPFKRPSIRIEIRSNGLQQNVVSHNSRKAALKTHAVPVRLATHQESDNLMIHIHNYHRKHLRMLTYPIRPGIEPVNSH
ncbi:hypothetical protein DPMN_159520 [Dreissena polymorpha]|uniref:Uncharacterized protein n=1 Tax=Dreissena polymorpha TaxID=45954 RepID=A0A9D4EPB0_DREPO|nr:hypothetical protein DPMN_159520 [Dreissena polymorpha]